MVIFFKQFEFEKVLFDPRTLIKLFLNCKSVIGRRPFTITLLRHILVTDHLANYNYILSFLLTNIGYVMNVSFFFRVYWFEI